MARTTSLRAALAASLAAPAIASPPALAACNGCGTVDKKPTRQ